MIKKLILGTALALSLGSTQANAMLTPALITMVNEYVNNTASYYTRTYLEGYLIGVAEGASLKLCVPPNLTNGEVVYRLAYAVQRNKSAYNNKASDIVTMAVIQEFGCK